MSFELQGLALMLYRIGAIKTRKDSPGGRGYRFKLHDQNPDAPLSPIKIDLRTADNPKPGPLDPEAVDLIGGFLSRLTVEKGLSFRGIAGVPRAGDPLAAAFNKYARRLLFKLDKNDEASGGRSITQVTHCPSHFPDGKEVLLVDDVITTSASKIEAIKAIQGVRGYTTPPIVKDVVVVVDNEQGGVERLAQIGVRVHALFTLRDLVRFYGVKELLTSSDVTEVCAYLGHLSS